MLRNRNNLKIVFEDPFLIESKVEIGLQKTGCKQELPMRETQVYIFKGVHVLLIWIREYPINSGMFELGRISSGVNDGKSLFI